MNRDIATIASAMTPFPHCIEKTETVKEAKVLMIRNEIRHLPVMDGLKIVGIISDRDVTLATAIARDWNIENDILVEDICVFDPYIVDLHASLEEVAGEMASRKIGSAIVTKNDRLAGIFTSTDACESLRKLLAAKRSSSIPDEIA